MLRFVSELLGIEELKNKCGVIKLLKALIDRRMILMEPWSFIGHKVS